MSQDIEVYDEAAQRHWRDAALLYDQERLENADQLFALAAECAVKVVLSKLPGCAPAGELSEGYRKHINELWERILVHNVAKIAPALPAVVRASNPFQDWRIEQRYARDGSVSASIAESHRQAARRILGACGLSGSRGK